MSGFTTASLKGLFSGTARSGSGGPSVRDLKANGYRRNPIGRRRASATFRRGGMNSSPTSSSTRDYEGGACFGFAAKASCWSTPNLLREFDKGREGRDWARPAFLYSTPGGHFLKPIRAMGWAGELPRATSRRHRFALEPLLNRSPMTMDDRPGDRAQAKEARRLGDPCSPSRVTAKPCSTMASSRHGHMINAQQTDPVRPQSARHRKAGPSAVHYRVSCSALRSETAMRAGRSSAYRPDRRHDSDRLVEQGGAFNSEDARERRSASETRAAPRLTPSCRGRTQARDRLWTYGP